MKTLIIGAGEIGNALSDILSKSFNTLIRDKEDFKIQGIEVLHICYPWSKDFIKSTREYIKEYQPKYTVIHSTVPVGTSRKLGSFHSPVRGVEPDLTQGIEP